MKHIKVVAAIIEKDNKILCMQRGQDNHEYTSFKWEFPGGKIEENETNEEALKRELFEEMNLDIDVNKFFGEFNYVYPDFEITLYLYKCSSKSDVFSLNVHSDFKWLYRNKLKTIDWAPADNVIINKLMEEN